MKTCDYCGKNIVGIREMDSISDREDIWNKSYILLKKARLSKISSRFKRVLWRIFYEPPMPAYYPDGIDFCNEKCYSKWKGVFNSKVRELLLKQRHEEKESEKK